MSWSSEGTRHASSPVMPSVSRLVASTDTFATDRNSSSLRQAVAARTCSQLSRTTRVGGPASDSASVSTKGRSGSARTSDSGGNRGGDQFWVGDARQLHPPGPPGWHSATSAASCNASRVLPQPPAPVRVTSRWLARCSRRAAISAPRPRKGVNCAGRLFGHASSESTGGNSVSISEWQSCHTRSGRARSFRRWGPRFRSVTPLGSRSTTRSRAASESRVWPPWATDRRRAHRMITGPL